MLWFSLRVREVPGSTPGQAPFSAFLEVQILQYNKNRKIKPKYKNEIIVKETVKHTRELESCLSDCQEITREWYNLFSILLVVWNDAM